MKKKKMFDTIIYGRLKALHPIAVPEKPVPVITVTSSSNSSFDSDKMHSPPYQRLYRAGTACTKYEYSSVNRSVYRAALAAITEAKELGFNIGTLVVESDLYPVTDWTLVPMMWVDQYLLSTVDPDMGYAPLLVSYVTDDNKPVYYPMSPEDLVILTEEDLAGN
jgi:hypothetical protein